MTDRRPMEMLGDPLVIGVVVLVAVTFGMGHAGPIFHALFPEQARALYEQESFPALLAAHLGLVGASSAISVIIGVAAGFFATSAAGQPFRGLVDVLVAGGQTFPPVAVLAIAVPALGFGIGPALLALSLYGLLPIVEGTMAGIGSVPPAALEAARGIGMTGTQISRLVVLPLASPIIAAGIRTSVVVNIGTAAIASTVGAKTLGLPIIIGLNGFNTAYILQGAIMVGLLAVVSDMALGRLVRTVAGHRAP